MLLLAVLFIVVASVSAFNDSVSLTELDRRLTHLLLHPEPGKGSTLLKDGYFLYTNLDDIADMIETKDAKGMKLYNEIQSAGGIQFHKAKYDPDTVRNTFDYNPDDYDMLQATVGGIENTLNNIALLLNETVQAQPTKPHSTITQW